MGEPRYSPSPCAAPVVPGPEVRAGFAPVLVLMLSMAASGCGAGVEQPIPFNHKVHVTRGALVCESCHETVFEQAYAGLPPVKICMRCHKTDTPEDETAAKRVEALRAYVKAGGDVPWQRVYRMPAFVYFSHRRHTETAGLACEVCHGAMAERTTPPTSPEGDTLTMWGCIGCHEKKKATTDCAACHH